MLFKIFNVFARIVLGALATFGTLLGIVAMLIVPISVWEGGQPYSALGILLATYVGTVVSMLLTADIVRDNDFELDLTRL